MKKMETRHQWTLLCLSCEDLHRSRTCPYSKTRTCRLSDRLRRLALVVQGGRCSDSGDQLRPVYVGLEGCSEHLLYFWRNRNSARPAICSLAAEPLLRESLKRTVLVDHHFLLLLDPLGSG